MIAGNLLFGCVLGWLWILLTGGRILRPLSIGYGGAFLVMPCLLTYGELKFVCAEFAGFTLGGVMHAIFRSAIEGAAQMSGELENRN
jgi:hypothetical protein